MMNGTSAAFRVGLVFCLAGLAVGLRAFLSPDCFRGACSVSGLLSGGLVVVPGAATPQSERQEAPPSSVAPTLKTLADAQDQLFALIVNKDGLVRYGLLKSDAALQSALASLVRGYADMPTPPKDAPQDRLAFWCNAYNVNVLDQVLKAGMPKKVLDVEGLFDRRPIRVGRVSLTLNDLENTHIRPMGDPRVHAALNCAAVSCPALCGKAFRPETIDRQLDDQCRRWVNDPTKNRVENRILHLSMIFTWFESDFQVERFGSVIGFLRAYGNSDSGLGAFLAATDPGTAIEIESIQYDWKLNAAPTDGADAPGK